MLKCIGVNRIDFGQYKRLTLILSIRGTSIPRYLLIYICNFFDRAGIEWLIRYCYFKNHFFRIEIMVFWKKS